MNEQFHIREMAKKDVDRFIEILTQSFVKGFEIRGFNEKTIRKVTRFLPLIKWMQKITGNITIKFYVGEINNTVVATGALNKSGKIWYVGNVMTAPEHRRRGYAERLMTKACEDARKYGGDYITLDVGKSNIAALNLYKKLGFQEFAETILLYKDAGAGQEELPIPQGYTLTKTYMFDSKVLEMTHACREPETAKVYGETTFPPFYIRLLLRVFKPFKIEQFAIMKNGEWTGIYSLNFKSEKEAAEASIQLLKSHRGKGIEEALLTRALKRTYELGAPRVITDFNRKNRELEKACRKLRFIESFVMRKMYKKL